MPFDFKTAIPVKEDEQGVERIDIGFDISSAKPVSGPEEATFRVLDNSGNMMNIAKSLFRGIERIPAGIGSGMEFLGRDIVAETKAETIPIVPFPGLKSISWLRMPKGKTSKVGQKIDDFFLRFGDTLAEIGKTAKDFYTEAANKGIESPNPAIMMGWKHPFKKVIGLAAENFPMLGLAAGVSTVTGSPTAGAAIFFPAIAGDMYEDAVKNGVDPLKAADMAYTTGAVQTALETIPLTGWMKGGHIIKRVFRTALQEGLIEEGSQQIFDNSLRVLGWKEPRPLWDRLTDGLAESILAGAVSGGALGVFEAPHIDNIRYDLHNEIIKDGMKQGLSEEQISQVIDKVDEVIDKTIGIEPTPIMPDLSTEEGKIGFMTGKINEYKGLSTEEIYNRSEALGDPEKWTEEQALEAEVINRELNRREAKEPIEISTEEVNKLTDELSVKLDVTLNEEQKNNLEDLSREMLVNEKVSGEEIDQRYKEAALEAFKIEQKIGMPLGGKIGVKPKVIPEVTEKIAWEQDKAWQVNLGRDIAGVFKKHIGPELQVSKRLKKWLGVYYPMLGENGLIRVRSVADEKTLFHETGHFLDDALGKVEIVRKKATREELVKVSKWLMPYDEATVSESYKAYRRSRPELFADYVAVYTINPDVARQLAPNFTKQVEDTIGQDREWQYVIDKLHQFEEAMKPLKEYVAALRKIPEFQTDLKDWVEKGNLLQQLWRSKVGDKVWDVYSKAIEGLGKKIGVKSFFEKGGLNDTVFEILRQRRKLIQGQQERVREEIVEPISELDKEEQQYIAESLQRFGEVMKDTELDKLTEEARKELAVWGNEARKLGLLNDEIFWNNVGQYFPFFYETKEFEKNKRNFGYFPLKAIRARFESLKHKLTDEEFGRKVLEAQYGTWPSAKKKIAEYSKEELVELGRNAREELGLIKTAAYPLQKRIFGMIEMTYTVKAFNTIATLPGIIGHKGVEGFDKMPEGKKYGALSGQYVSVDLVKEVSKWNVMRSELGEVWRSANAIWKMFKVPYSPAAVSRNIVTNALMAWMGDVPIYNPVVAVKGVKSFIAKDEAYKLLRDGGLYHNTYSEQEMKELAFQIDQDPNNPYKQIMIWANNLGEAIQSPARLYGAIEDASKTVIARYVLDSGGTPEQAVRFADKLLFDYSQVSEAVGYARQSFWPFITWSAKVLPRLVEFAIRKPEKYILMIAAVGIWNAISRAMLGIEKDDEEKLKPDYIRGKSVLLLPGRDINDDLNWIDLTYFLPWGSWLPIEKGDFAAPSVFNIGGPLIVLYNAYILNHDPFYGEIAPDYLSEDEQMIKKGKYIAKSLFPQILTTTPGKLINSTKPDKYGRQKEIGKILSGEFLGVKFIQDTSAYRSKIMRAIQQDFYKGRAKLRNQLRDGEITQEEYDKEVRKLQKKLRGERESH